MGSLYRDKNHCSVTVHHCSSTVHVLKNIKNGSHGTIHTFKNYLTTVFSDFSFSNNKFNPNGSIDRDRIEQTGETVQMSIKSNFYSYVLMCNK